jgi:ribulose-phosphate 3-epimerase
MRIRISVSLTDAPLIDLRRVVELLNRSSIDMIHFDIGDGHFVPDISLGMNIIKSLRPFSSLLFDIHVMMIDPERIVPRLIQLGANRISVHWEACEYPLRALSLIKSLGAIAGLAFNPKTDVPNLDYLLPSLDFVNILTTESGPEDCDFIPSIIKKVYNVKKCFRGIQCEIDGGITPQNVYMAIEAGTDVIVVGRHIFHNQDIQENIQSILKSVGS